MKGEIKMQIGNKVWIFDGNNREYVDDKGNKIQSPWYRGHFIERYIVGETKQSWVIGYKNSSMEDISNLKINKKTLTYNGTYGLDGRLYISEEEIDRKCWVHDNHYKMQDLVMRCNDYDKLKRIEEILLSEQGGYK